MLIFISAFFGLMVRMQSSLNLISFSSSKLSALAVTAALKVPVNGRPPLSSVPMNFSSVKVRVTLPSVSTVKLPTTFALPASSLSDSSTMLPVVTSGMGRPLGSW